jgi:two-component system response regulator YesN
MKKVLIIDDEFLIRAGLQTAIDWKSCECEVVGFAKNASDAILLYRKFNPDIVITEISLPDTNGLVLIPQLQQYHNNTKFIIFTRNQSFEYAKKAIQLSVSEYLLKSEVTREALENILRSFEITPEAETSNANAASSAASGLYDYITDNLILSGSEVNRLFAQNGLISRNFVVLSIEMFNGGGNYTQGDNGFPSECFKEIVGKIKSDMPSDDFNMVFLHDNDRIYAVINYNISIFLPDIAELIRKTLDERLNAHTLIGASAVTNDCAKVNNAAIQADIAKNTAYFSDKYWVQYENHMSCDNSVKLDMNVLNYKSCANKTDFLDKIDLILDAVKKSRSLDVVKRSLDQYRDNLKTLYQQVTSSEDLNESPSFASAIPDDLRELFNFTLYRDCILSIYSSFYSQVLNTPKSSFIVQKCIDYIHDSYATPINLASISDEFNISYSYLSYLFVKMTNVKMHQYINNVRIEHAKRLLKTSSMKMYDIAQNVGFESPYYFSKVFKEITGLTCSEYKKGQKSI